MKKFSKILLIIIAIIIVLTPAIIPISNNIIANNIKKALKEIPLPEQTKLVDSFSNAGKIVGNGNGMQYFGAILVKSELDIEDLMYYYQSYPYNLKIERQESEKIVCDDIHKNLYFKKFDTSKSHYIVYMWGESPNGFISKLLDLDLRGH